MVRPRHVEVGRGTRGTHERAEIIFPVVSIRQNEAGSLTHAHPPEAILASNLRAFPYYGDPLLPCISPFPSSYPPPFIVYLDGDADGADDAVFDTNNNRIENDWPI